MKKYLAAAIILVSMLISNFAYSANGLIAPANRMNFSQKDMTMKSLTLTTPLHAASGGCGTTSLAECARRVTIGLPRTPKILPAGDSITAGSNTVTLTGLPRLSTASDYISGAIFSSGKYIYLANAGVVGNTSTQLLARFQTDVIAKAPHVVPIMIGTNDFSSGMANSVYTTLFNNLEQMVIMCLNNGILPIIVTPPPKATAITEAKNAQWYYYALANYYGIPLIDVYRIWTDPITGDFVSGYTGDGTHPNASAIAATKSVVLATLDSLGNPPQYPYLGVVSEASAGAFSNLVRNGSFAQITTPPAPDGWTIDGAKGTYVTSAESYPYTGNYFEYTDTGGAAYALQGSTTTAYSVGDVMYLAARMQTSTLSGESQILVNHTGIATPPLKIATSLTADGFYSCMFTIPTGTTNISPKVYMTDTGVAKISNVTIVNVTQHEAIWKPGQQ